STSILLLGKSWCLCGKKTAERAQPWRAPAGRPRGRDRFTRADRAARQHSRRAWSGSPPRCCLLLCLKKTHEWGKLARAEKIFSRRRSVLPQHLRQGPGQMVDVFLGAERPRADTHRAVGKST